MSCQTASLPVLTSPGVSGIKAVAEPSTDRVVQEVAEVVGTLDLVVSPSKTFQKVLPLNIPNSIEVIYVKNFFL